MKAASKTTARVPDYDNWYYEGPHMRTHWPGLREGKQESGGGGQGQPLIRTPVGSNGRAETDRAAAG